MKKYLYLFMCLILSCISFDFTKHGLKSKDYQDRVVEEQSKTNLILKPFKALGLLWSCAPEEEPSSGGSHQSHQSHQSHSSHYSSR